ncbi:MAG: DUF3102 domain-containing protein [Oscillospiraceae bacterium]|nr:DUF3102 domain-containing protein [Oscillospiraceae bacterium]
MDDMVNRETVVPAERTVETVTAEIRVLHRQAQQLVLEYAMEIGRRLVEVKAMLPHGAWGNYLKEQVGYSQSTANNFMRIFEEYGAAQLGIFGPEAKSQTLGNLPYTKALKLLALPEDEREEFVESHDVEGMSTRELEAAIRARDEAQQAAETAREELSEERARAAGYQAEREKAAAEAESAAAELARLREQLTELENAPRDVAVETVADEEAVKAAADAARREAEEKLKKKIEQAEKAKQKAEEAKGKAEQELAARRVAQEQAESRIERERQEFAGQMEELRKKLAVASSSELTIFQLHFDQAQECQCQ